METIAVVGLGPAGLALAHRAAMAGWAVTGYDPHPNFHHTVGVFLDELPEWAQDMPFESVSTPVVYLHDGTRVEVDREYGILSPTGMQEQLTTFITVERAVDPASLLARADVVVDARGNTPNPGDVVQLAWDSFGPLTGETVWMDFRGDPEMFTYSVPTAHGQLTERTVLATAFPERYPAHPDVVIPLNPAPWTPQSAANPPGDEPGAADANPDLAAVLSALDAPADEGARIGRMIPFGARAGLMNAITGYSVATSLRLVDPTLQALVEGTPLPWEQKAMATDIALNRQLLTAMLSLDPPTRRLIVEAATQLPVRLQRAFLSLGTRRATLQAMTKIYVSLPKPVRAAVREAFARAKNQTV
ncbi:MAG: lycopene cyclase family protein [Corynebacterium sp.]|nr:lycopene cyclase family protein [Corynebacterium sp.]